MRHALGLALMLLSITSSGCALMEDSCRNVMVGIKTPIEEHREKARNREWAETAWWQVSQADRTQGPFECCLGKSDDYAQGFKDGFAEYLYRGGDGEPPLVAPLRYRDSRYQNEAGYHAVENWFAGYRHGAAMARDSGARKWITGPSSLRGELDGHHVDEGPPLSYFVPEKPAPIPLPEPKVVPAPKVMPKPAGEQGSVKLPPPLKFFEPEAAPAKAALDRPQVQQVRLNENGSPWPEALRIQIRKVTEAARQPDPTPEASPEQPAIEPLPEPVRLRILKISEAANGTDAANIGSTEVQDAPPPARPRITGINVAPQKD